MRVTGRRRKKAHYRIYDLGGDAAGDRDAEMRQPLLAKPYYQDDTVTLYHGIEKNRDYCDLAVSRLRQSSLFEAAQ